MSHSRIPGHLTSKPYDLMYHRSLSTNFKLASMTFHRNIESDHALLSFVLNEKFEGLLDLFSLFQSHLRLGLSYLCAGRGLDLGSYPAARFCQPISPLLSCIVCVLSVSTFHSVGSSARHPSGLVRSLARLYYELTPPASYKHAKPKTQN